VAEDLDTGCIVGWFQGREEIGPRALGRRSLLANPALRDSLIRLNRIKGREPWRPVAPSVLAEHADLVFEPPVNPHLGRFMLTVATVRKDIRRHIPAVVHVDYSARPHLVDRHTDPLYWEMIDRFRARTGIPLICNTSLNVEGEPIVHTPENALNLFKSAHEVNTMAIGPFYLRR
jgi:carbamoyltransferase